MAGSAFWWAWHDDTASIAAKGQDCCHTHVNDPAIAGTRIDAHR
jgi:hypothetical protein